MPAVCMMTKIIKIDPGKPDPEKIDEAVAILKNGGKQFAGPGGNQGGQN